MSDTIKVAVVGNGNISKNHLSGYAKNPHAEIVALCDILPVARDERGEQFGVPAERRFGDVREMLSAVPEIDAVSICTWNAAHADCAIAALEAGKHVLCEKPMAVSVAQAEAMRDAAQRSGKLLMMGFVRRFGNDCDVVKDFIDKGYFGDIYYAKATYLRRKGCPGGWFGEKARAGGGPLIDLGVHVIDLCRYLMGNPKPVSVYGATFNKLGDRPGIKLQPKYVSRSRAEKVPFDVEDLATAMIRFDNGAVLQIEASFSLNIEKDEGTIQLFGDKAGARLDPGLTIYSEMNGHMTNVTLAESTALSFDGLFEREIDHFIDCVRTGRLCRTPAEDGVTLMKILCGIYESAATGHEVVL